MKQRLGLAQAMMENPDILILDEPMNALDSIGVSDIREILLDKRFAESIYVDHVELLTCRWAHSGGAV